MNTKLKKRVNYVLGFSLPKFTKDEWKVCRYIDSRRYSDSRKTTLYLSDGTVIENYDSFSQEMENLIPTVKERYDNYKEWVSLYNFHYNMETE